MKKLLLLLAIFSVTLGANAQSNINADCINAIPLCATPNFTFNATSGVGTVTDIPSPSNISNPSTNPASTNSGCLLSGELKPQWLLITIGNAGNLEFVFGAGNSSNPQVGYYDWAMWPYSPTTCSGIQNNTLPPVRCNWNGSSTGGTGIASSANIPPGGSASNYEPALAVLPCQQFIICISNYSGVNTLVSFQSVGSASLSCNPSCISVNNPIICAGVSASIIAASSGNLASLAYSLNPGGLTSSTPTFVINPTTSGAYTVYATGLNSASVAVTQTAVSNVTVNASPNAAPTTTQATCTNFTNAFNLGLGFTPSSATPNYTVTWSSIPNGVTSPTQTSASGSISPGAYTATITSTGGCFTVTSFTIDPNPAPASISLIPFGPTYVVTCYEPTVNVTAANASFNYTWTNGLIAPINGPAAAFNSTAAGVWTITAVNPASGCVSTKTISVAVNTIAPNSIITPTFQNITCNLTSVTTITATSSQTVNITHVVTSPQGGTFSANSYSTVYAPGGPGTYTYCLINDINGCSSCKEFTVASNQGFPTYSVTSPQSFTLGCGSKSVATINIINGNTTPQGGAVSYTLLSPGSPTTTPSGSLSTISTYTVVAPGTWTAITKDNVSFCETRVAISVISNTAGPSIDSVIVPTQLLDCNIPQVTLEVLSETPNIGYNWTFPGQTGNLPTNTIVVTSNTATPNNTVIASYTMTVRDNNNTCVSTTVIPMRQNLYQPKASISNGGVPAFTCKTSTIMLTNTSSSGIPANSQFPVSLPVIGYEWRGPTPQLPLTQSSTYLAQTVGQYTLIARDMNNGCISSTITTLNDNKVYPAISPSVNPAILDCGSSNATLNIVSNPPGSYSYSWTTPQGANTSPPTSATLLTNKTGIYRVIATNTVNGCATTAEARVENGSLDASISVDKESGFAPLTVTLTNLSSSTSGTTGIITAWNSSNGSQQLTNSASVQPVIVFNQAGTYTITAYVTKGSCVDTASRVITVDIPSVLEIPNVFTPNGDNVNDIFFLKTASLARISIWIYDRWGHLVYELVSEKGNIAWDGKNQQGRDVAEGTYLYILKADGKDGQTFDKKGTLTLVR